MVKKVVSTRKQRRENNWNTTQQTIGQLTNAQQRDMHLHFTHAFSKHTNTDNDNFTNGDRNFPPPYIFTKTGVQHPERFVRGHLCRGNGFNNMHVGKPSMVFAFAAIATVAGTRTSSSRNRLSNGFLGFPYRALQTLDHDHGNQWKTKHKHNQHGYTQCEGVAWMSSNPAFFF